MQLMLVNHYVTTIKNTYTRIVYISYKERIISNQFFIPLNVERFSEQSVSLEES